MTIVITGNPGVGKHTTAERITEQKRLSVLDINNIAKKEGLFEESRNTNDVDVERLEKIINKKISKSSLIVGHLAPYVVSSDKVDKVIVLRRNPYDLLEVYEKRGYSEEKSRENAGSEVLGIIANDAISKFGDKVFQVNTTGKTIKEVTETVLDILDNNHRTEEIDWLGMITKQNDLKKFFAY